MRVVFYVRRSQSSVLNLKFAISAICVGMSDSAGGGLETRWSRAIGADFRKGVSTMEKPKGFGPLALPESNATSYPMA